MSGQRGFTLLEMLAALAVLALCATVLLGAFGQSARALQQTARSDRLNLAALSLVADLEAGPLAVGERRGQWDGLDWRCIIKALPTVTGAAELLQLDVTLEDGQRQARFSTLRVRSAGTGS